MRKPSPLAVLAAFMGVLILAGLVLFAYGMAKTAGEYAAARAAVKEKTP